MTTKEFVFSNGDLVREKVTGFTGVITGVSFFITGCDQYLVTAKSKDDGSKAEALWYDEGRLELVKEAAIPAESVQADENGCDMLPPVGERGA